MRCCWFRNDRALLASGTAAGCSPVSCWEASHSDGRWGWILCSWCAHCPCGSGGREKLCRKPVIPVVLRLLKQELLGLPFSLSKADSLVWLKKLCTTCLRSLMLAAFSWQGFVVRGSNTRTQNGKRERKWVVAMAGLICKNLWGSHGNVLS